MEILVWPCFALFVLAVLLRSGKRRDGIDWKSRGLLLLVSTAICLLLDRWIRISALNAAEAAATANVAVDSLTIDLAARYQPVLLPIYIAIVAVLIDAFARLTHRGVVGRVGDRNRGIAQTLLANSLLFVVTPALPYVWAALNNSGSIVADAARDVFMPIIGAYGAPAYWLQLVSTDTWAWQRAAHTSWPWNPGYRVDSYISFYRFLTDCLPWLALSISMSCLSLLRSHAIQHQSLSEYFIAPQSASQASLLARIAYGPWRGRAAVAFTLIWTLPLATWLGLVVLTLSLSYVLLGLFVLALAAASVGLIALLVRISKARAP